VLRREPLALPYGDQAPLLSALARGLAVPEPDDPERFAEAVLHHRLSAFAAEAAEAGRLALPDTQARAMADAAAIHGLFARRLAAELAVIEPLVADACWGRPLVLKGPASARLYERTALRPYGDLDLLVAREDLRPAAEALLAHGYEENVEFDTGFGETHGHDVHVRRGTGHSAVDVELHWRVGDDDLGRGLSHERLSEGARLFSAHGTECLAPAPEAELLALGVHLLSDRSKRMIWVCDVERAARALDDAAWDGAFALARDLSLLWPLHRALDYAQHHLAYERARPLPAGEAPPWGPLRAVEELDLRASLHVGRLAALRGPRERARYARRILLPSRRGLRDRFGADGAPTWRLVGRHIRDAVAGARSRRR
jgi:putative nucleotidyltransferase-like protein